MKLTVIIPAYNEEKTISEILRRVEEVSLGEVEKEIVVVDDGSRDQTPVLVSEFVKKHANARMIVHKKNRGKGAAVINGIRNATGDILIIQDADLEYNPQDIPRLISPIVKKKFRVVYGTRLRNAPVLFGKNKTPLIVHYFGNKILSLITSLLYGARISDMETCYKAFDKNVLQGVRLRSRSFNFEPEITAKILKKRIKIYEIDIKTKPRGWNEGKKLHTVRDGSIALWTLLKYRFVN
ncbi:MAG TPA: glycosyltransferase family 2 protein [Candidatus Levybacteria bacterium]|nr:glycosyltransferase family 2 protein [Candidatus Levybacteria bacterium]